MNRNKKEVLAQASANIFRSIASMMDAAYVFYEAGYPEEGDATVDNAQKIIEALPEFKE